MTAYRPGTHEHTHTHADANTNKKEAKEGKGYAWGRPIAANSQDREQMEAIGWANAAWERWPESKGERKARSYSQHTLGLATLEYYRV